LAVLGLATVAPVVIVAAIAGAIVGVISTEEMIDLALAAGENPGMITFGAMFLASPVQWLTGRSQIRVRKYLGIVFYLLALSNGAMFVIEEQVGAMLSEPLLVAGTAALALAAPLFVTSNRFSQRLIGMRNWRLLHRLTYVVAVALLGHVILVGDLGLGSALIALGFIARIPPVRRLLESRSNRAAARTD
jgi:DMSO/TMAO reductase YedYZ heme-binding membrane subunit